MVLEFSILIRSHFSWILLNVHSFSLFIWVTVISIFMFIGIFLFFLFLSRIVFYLLSGTCGSIDPSRCRGGWRVVTTILCLRYRWRSFFIFCWVIVYREQRVAFLRSLFLWRGCCFVSGLWILLGLLFCGVILFVREIHTGFLLTSFRLGRVRGRAFSYSWVELGRSNL